MHLVGHNASEQVTVVIMCIYRICLAIKGGFLHRMTPNMLINPMKSCYKMGSPVQNNPKNLDLSYKMDLDI